MSFDFYRLAHEAQIAKMQAESTHKHEVFLKKERTVKHEIYDLMYKCSMYPIGKDRYYRRYWAFKTLPGLFVEDWNENWPIDNLLEGNLDRVCENNTGGEVKPEANGQVDYGQVTENGQVQVNGKEGKSQLSDLTNLSNNTNGGMNGQSISKMDTNEDESNGEEKGAVVKAESVVAAKPEYSEFLRVYCSCRSRKTLS